MGTWEANAAFEAALMEPASPEADIRLRKAIEDGANARMLINHWSGAMFAAGAGRAEALAMLLDAGVDPNLSSRASGRTAAMLAAAGGHGECLALLVKKGAALEDVDDQGWTPLMWAALEGHGGCVRVLAGAGANLDARSAPPGEKPLKKKSPSPGPIMFSANLRKAEHMGGQRLTALMISAIKGDASTLSLLAELGADQDVECKEGLDARMWARMHGKADCMAVFDALDERAALRKATSGKGKSRKSKPKTSAAPQAQPESIAKRPRL